ncbi:ImmA/IrrE family metallo-endopeptidase [Rhodovulum sp. PH10]|uniref:ImmA/IrrE family metallo-endopeptidase n=1 Tax=Rhodovulum sp. PH10 TaxID=1187851 RepID=UPI0003190D06|nr:ImmA/IrrE family metallo-endopeptidase [Rhodovulum sp. PH10]
MARKQSDDPEARAEETLASLNIRSLPIPVEKVAKGLGAQVRFSPLDEELSGMIFIKDGVPIIGVNALHHPNRQRFTISHEIGHLVLHKDMITAEVHVDKGFPILMRDAISATGTQQLEIAANRFASALLMPMSFLKQALAGKSIDIDDEKSLEALAKKFRVSRQALEYRMRKLTELG